MSHLIRSRAAVRLPGLLIEMTGMARAMVAFLASLLGHVKAACTTCWSARCIWSRASRIEGRGHGGRRTGVVSGMKARGARPGVLVALLAATGAQTETHPAEPRPDHHRVGDGLSISALFTGGLLPGVVLAITLSALVWWRYRARI